MVASGGEVGTVRLWDAATGAPRGEPLTGHRGSVNAVAFGTVEGRAVVASGGDDGTVRVWETTSGAELAVPVLDPAQAVVVVPGGLVVGAGSAVVAVDVHGLYPLRGKPVTRCRLLAL